MKTTIYRAEERGHTNYGWLDAHYTFSFSNYYDPERISFGMLRVLNDDIIAPGTGLKEHGHDNMEIISIPLYGVMAHKDSSGHEEVLQNHDVQVMSAGKGIRHSEYNFSHQDKLNFLQLWIFPKEKNTEPHYDKRRFEPDQYTNKLLNIVAPQANGAAKVNQDAWLYIGKYDKDETIYYSLKGKDHGLFVFMINGDAEIGGEIIHNRDGMGICQTDLAVIKPKAGSEMLVVDVPMH